MDQADRLECSQHGRRNGCRGMREPGRVVYVRNRRGIPVIMRARPRVGGIRGTRIFGRVDMDVLMPGRRIRVRMQLQAGDTRKSDRAEERAQQQPAVPATDRIQSEAPHGA